MKELTESEFEDLVREVVKEEFGMKREEDLVECIRIAREKIEHTTAKLEDLYNLVEERHPDMADWVRGIVEDQKDVYQELMDFETEVRT